LQRAEGRVETLDAQATEVNSYAPSVRNQNCRRIDVPGIDVSRESSSNSRALSICGYFPWPQVGDMSSFVGGSAGSAAQGGLPEVSARKQLGARCPHPIGAKPSATRPVKSSCFFSGSG
jgi:hypothetical protein